jgi:hypothetical protein
VPRLQLFFVKRNIAYQYVAQVRVCNFLVLIGKSAHNRRLLKLFLKCRELLFQFGDFVSKLGDFPFEFHESF